MIDLQEYLKAKAQAVDICLDELLPKANGEEKVLYEAMRYSVFAGGKRLRPCLFLATLEALGITETGKFLPFACALEMIHTYSLIHDDLPAMDDDDFRRGKPSCHKAFGEAQAILAGDALLTYSFNAMLRLRPDTNAQSLLHAIDEVAWSAGIGGMVTGQVVDIIWEGKPLDLPLLQYIHKNKTGALFHASIISAAILAGADEREMAALSNYANHIGLVFQITDDILDVVGDESKLGKQVGMDARNNKTTYPSLLGLDKAREAALESVKAARDALLSFGERADILSQIPSFFLNRES